MVKVSQLGERITLKLVKGGYFHFEQKWNLRF